MPIDRRALVERHRVRLTAPDRLSPLSVGNGELAFTADITGLQSFPAYHARGAELPGALRPRAPGEDPPGTQLATMAQWGWHRMPNPHGHRLEDTLSAYQTRRGPVTYPDRYDLPFFPPTGRHSAAGEYLAGNPHRLDLGRVGLELRRADGRPAQIEDLEATEQTLDLWRGLLASEFRLDGEPVRVWTVCHPERDVVAARVESPLLADGRLAVTVAFPYASDAFNVAADWGRPEAHATEHATAGDRCDFTRTLDDARYVVAAAWSAGGALAQAGPHEYRVSAPGAQALEIAVAFAPEPIAGQLPTFAAARAAAAAHWARFWSEGGAVELAGSADPRAHELERRIVLSQYQTAVNCAGSTPPQETGLVCSSWRGKFHLEMHWWHAAHFALWGRPQLLERSMPWYQRALDVARGIARRQGYPGARWPKEVGPDASDAPNQIGPFLIWQQPHPISYAELLWRARPGPETLARYRDIVLETAAFMAAFPEEEGGELVLGPPLVPAQESYWPERESVMSPTFELAYWWWGLETAQRWRERLGMGREPAWERVKERLARPTVRDGVYAAIATPPYTTRNDHPSMLMALGFVPPTPLVDPDVMRATLLDVRDGWDWPSTWGWDYPVMAMCAARLGERRLAVDALLMPMPKNTYLPSGHNMQVPGFLPLYLPGNGGLLAAVAMMAAGWDGAEGAAPGFPDDGSWRVAAEGLLRAL